MIEKPSRTKFVTSERVRLVDSRSERISSVCSDHQQLPDPLAHRCFPRLFPQRLAHLDLLNQGNVAQLTIAGRMAQDEIVDRAWPTATLSDQVLQAGCSCGIRLCLEVNGSVAEPAPPAVAGAQALRLAQLIRSRHFLRLTEALFQNG